MNKICPKRGLTCQLQLFGRLLTTTPYSVRLPPVAPLDLSSRPTSKAKVEHLDIPSGPHRFINYGNSFHEKDKELVICRRVTQYLLLLPLLYLLSPFHISSVAHRSYTHPFLWRRPQRLRGYEAISFNNWSWSTQTMHPESIKNKRIKMVDWQQIISLTKDGGISGLTSIVFKCDECECRRARGHF